MLGTENAWFAAKIAAGDVKAGGNDRELLEMGTSGGFGLKTDAGPAGCQNGQLWLLWFSFTVTLSISRFLSLFVYSVDSG